MALVSPNLVACPACAQPVAPRQRFCVNCGAPIDLDTSCRPLPPETRLGAEGRYQIEQRLSAGGFGEVYRARDRRLNRLCVVKRMRHAEGLPARELRLRRERFLAEAERLAALNVPGHPNIPEIFDVLADEVCLVMKYIEGRSLQGRLDRLLTSGLDEAVALRYLHIICDALVYMHSRVPPVLHRDIKPDNVVVDGQDRPWLVDFGLAQDFPLPSSSDETMVGGTFGYAPSEQLGGAAEPRSDIYALGTTLYVLLTNPQRPFGPTTATATAPGANRRLPPLRTLNPGIRVEVEALIERCRVEQPSERPSAIELRAELAALLMPQEAPPPTPEPVPDAPGFLGREQALGDARRVLSREGIVVVAGPPGIGKSVFTAQLVKATGRERPVFWHTCRPVDGQATVLLWALAGFLFHQGLPELWRWLSVTAQPGTRPPPFETLVRALGTQLRACPALICLDDADALDSDPNADALFQLLLTLASDGTAQLVMTGRAAPSSLRLTSSPPLNGLDLDTAMALLRQEQVPLTDAQATALHNATGGSPQFLLLAAAAIRDGGDLDELIAQLPVSAKLTNYLLVKVDARLHGEERPLLQALALLEEPVSLDALEATLDRDQLWSPLRRLHTHHLVESNRDRYWLHGILRGFFRQQLSRRSSVALHRRAAAFFEHEERDLLRAITHHLEAGAGAQAAALAANHLWEAINMGHGPRIAGLFPQLLAQELAPQLQIMVLQACGELADLHGDDATAEDSFQRALRALDTTANTPERAVCKAQICRGMGTLLRTRQPSRATTWINEGLAALSFPGIPQDTFCLERGRLLHQLGSVLLVQGREPEALEALVEAHQLLPTKEERWRAHMKTNLGVAYCALGEVARGLALYSEAEALYRQLKDDWGLAVVIHNQAIELDYAGNWAAAEHAYSQALDLARRLGDVDRQAVVALTAGTLYAQRGDFTSARRLLADSIALAERHQLHEYAVAANASLAEIALRQGVLPEAERALAAAQSFAHTLGSTDQAAEISRCEAQIALSRGATEAAMEAAQRALAAAKEAEDNPEIGLALRVLALVLLACDEPTVAAEHLHESVALLSERPYEVARSLAMLGLAQLRGGDEAEGRRKMEQAREMFVVLGATFDQDEVDSWLIV